MTRSIGHLRRGIERVEKRLEGTPEPNKAHRGPLFALGDATPRPLSKWSTEDLDRAIAALEAGGADIEVEQRGKRQVVRVHVHPLLLPPGPKLLPAPRDFLPLQR